ncbi:MAG TPA: prepilin-type N-terminal cleavage/methylation domain-containing protein [Dissulfurispiraceae bacterium]|nr:prepilin-type N-terminal cleavage/methylation domain-containing protein [Dissulfurispiraceae bacterium]
MINTSVNKMNRGFTLVEVLLALAIGTFIMAAVLTAVMQGYSSSSGIEQSVAVQEDVRAALDIMSHEIAMASYASNPSASSIWRTTAGGCPLCDDLTTCTYKGIQEATASALTIEMDTAVPENLTIGDANEIIRYEYLPGKQMVTRATGCPNVSLAQPFLSADSASTSAKARNVAVTNGTRNIPLFQYYDGTGAEILPAALPARIPDIRRIKITVAVQATVPDFKGQMREMIYSTSVMVRNHAPITSK